MKTMDAMGIAARGAMGKGNLLPVAGIAACVFCLCFAGASLARIQQEKALPSELTVTAGQVSLSSSTVPQLEQIPGVVTATPVVQFLAQLAAGEYTAHLTVTGLHADYINQAFHEGAIFPENAAMPYLVLNDAACKQFSKDIIDFQEKETDIRWLGAGLILRLDEANSVAARVCGILEGKAEEPPLVLMDYAAAQALLRSMEQPTDPQQIFVRVQNSGVAQHVAEEIAALGYGVSQPDADMEQAWASSQKEASYLILLGLLSLCLAVVGLRGSRKLALCKEQGLLHELGWLGMRDSTVRRIIRMQTMLIALYGSAFGLASLSIPAVLQRDVVEGTSFALPVPWWVWTGSAVLTALLFAAGVHFRAGISRQTSFSSMVRSGGLRGSCAEGGGGTF